jgi:hypothetical protein
MLEIHRLGPGFMYRSNEGFVVEAFEGSKRDVVGGHQVAGCCDCFKNCNPCAAIKQCIKDCNKCCICCGFTVAGVDQIEFSPSWRITINSRNAIHAQSMKSRVHDWTYVIELSIENDPAQVQTLITSLIAHPDCKSISGPFGGGLPRVVEYLSLKNFQHRRPLVSQLDIAHGDLKAEYHHKGMILEDNTFLVQARLQQDRDKLKGPCCVHPCMCVCVCVCV